MNYAIEILTTEIRNLMRIALQNNAMYYAKGIIKPELDYTKEIAELKEAILILQIAQQTK